MCVLDKIYRGLWVRVIVPGTVGGRSGRERGVNPHIETGDRGFWVQCRVTDEMHHGFCVVVPYTVCCIL